MNSVETIIEDIKKLSGKYNPHIIFSDWVRMYAISIQNSCTLNNKLWEKREEEYIPDQSIPLTDGIRVEQDITMVSSKLTGISLWCSS